MMGGSEKDQASTRWDGCAQPRRTRALAEQSVLAALQNYASGRRAERTALRFRDGRRCGPVAIVLGTR